MNIPLINLRKQYETIKEEIDQAIQDVVLSTRFVGGENVAKFEEEFAAYIGTRYCVSVGSGTDSLILGIRGLGFSGDDEIIVPANTFNASAAGISENRLKPVVVDIDEQDYGINLEDLARKINSRTKAIMIVHLFGQSDKIDGIKKVIKKSGKNILIIEDSCQAHGAYFKNKRVGNFGAFSGFSFYPGKNLGAYGEGGAIVTNSAHLAKICRMFKDHGQITKYKHQVLGINSNLDALQAAILRVKLNHLDNWNALRRKQATYYTRSLKPLNRFVITPNQFPERKSVYHLYVIRVKRRNALLKYLNEKGIGVGIHYPTPLHLQKAYEYLNYKKGDLPVSEKIAKEVLSLPLYPELTKEEIAYTVNCIQQFYA